MVRGVAEGGGVAEWDRHDSVQRRLTLRQLPYPSLASQWHENVLTGYESIDRNLVINHEGMLQVLIAE